MLDFESTQTVRLANALSMSARELWAWLDTAPRLHAAHGYPAVLCQRMLPTNACYITVTSRANAASKALCFRSHQASQQERSKASVRSAKHAQKGEDQGAAIERSGNGRPNLILQGRPTFKVVTSARACMRTPIRNRTIPSGGSTESNISTECRVPNQHDS